MTEHEFINHLRDRNISVRVAQQQKEWTLYFVQSHETGKSALMVTQDYGEDGFEVFVQATRSNQIADTLNAVTALVTD